MNKGETVPRPHFSSLEDCVDAIAHLPESLTGHYGMVETLASNKLLVDFHFAYCAQALWLGHLVAKKELDPKCHEPEVLAYEPHAKAAAAMLELCTDIHSQDTSLQEQFPTPRDLWYRCRRCECKKSLRGAGILPRRKANYAQPRLPQSNEQGVTIRGKSAWRSINQSTFKKLENLTLSKEDFSSDVDWGECFDYGLILLGVQIAKEDRVFRLETWRNFVKVFIKVRNVIRRSKKYQMPYLDDGGYQILKTGLSRQVSQSRSAGGGRKRKHLSASQGFSGAERSKKNKPSNF